MLPDLDALARTHQHQATQESERLAALAELPPGAAAAAAATAPDALSGPTMGTPATGSLIDTVHFFSVPVPLPSAVRWITAK